MLPVVEFMVGQNMLKALMVMGCTMTLMTLRVTKKWKALSNVWMVDSSKINCKGNNDLEIVMRGTTLRL